MVLGAGNWTSAEGGGFWMGCMGYEHSSPDLVCLVAGVDYGNGAIVWQAEE